MGSFIFPRHGWRPGTRCGVLARLDELLASHPGFPLKVWDKDGKVTFEVTKIEQGSVDQSMFEIPEGYMDMGEMFGGRGRGGGGN